MRVQLDQWTKREVDVWFDSGGGLFTSFGVV